MAEIKIEHDWIEEATDLSEEKEAIPAAVVWMKQETAPDTFLVETGPSFWSDGRSQASTTGHSFKPELDDDFLEAVNEDCSDVDSDVDSDYVIPSDHDSATEEEIDDDPADFDNSGREKAKLPPYFCGRNGFKWASKEPANTFHSVKEEDGYVYLPSIFPPVASGEKIEPIHVWDCILNSTMINIIATWTSVKLQKLKGAGRKGRHPELDDVDTDELMAVIGLLLYTAAFKSNEEPLSAIFACDGTGREIFRLVMAHKRFTVLLRHIQFDNPDDRNHRCVEDPTAPISELLNHIITNSQNLYCLGTQVCVDEMIISFRGRCKFKMYMPNKTGLYGLKFFCMTDAKTNYFYNGYIYSGPNEDGHNLSPQEKQLSNPSQVVLRLTEPIHGTNRNITSDSWFASVEIAQALAEKNLTFLGAIKKSKPEIPREFLPSKLRDAGSTIYGFSGNLTLVSHVLRKNKAMLLLSSMHHCKGKSTSNDLPEMVDMFNTTKTGVENLHRKCVAYPCSRRTRRWSMATFYRLLEIVTCNAYILHCSLPQSGKMTKFDFLKTLAGQMVRPHLEKRMYNRYLPREISAGISRVLQMKFESDVVEEKLEKRKTCRRCPNFLKRKTSYVCFKCKVPVCLQCTKKICYSCATFE